MQCVLSTPWKGRSGSAITRDLALASMARDDSPASSTASSTAAMLQAARRPQCAVKWDRNLKPKLAIMRQCTSVTDRRTDGLASWHKCEMYILHLALKRQWFGNSIRMSVEYTASGSLLARPPWESIGLCLSEGRHWPEKNSSVHMFKYAVF